MRETLCIRSVARAALFAFALGGLAAPALAADVPRAWQVAEGSRVAFDFVLDGKPRSGVFDRVTGQGRFDPAAPEAAELEIRIAADSIDLDHALFSAYAQSAEWFDAKAHPEVVFRLVRLTPLGGARYEALGDLEIRGRSGPVRGEIRLEVSETGAVAAGRLEVDRLDYGLGVGPSSLIVDVAPAVAVRFELAARPAAD